MNITAACSQFFFYFKHVIKLVVYIRKSLLIKIRKKKAKRNETKQKNKE